MTQEELKKRIEKLDKEHKKYHGNDCCSYNKTTKIYCIEQLYDDLYGY